MIRRQWIHAAVVTVAMLAAGMVRAADTEAPDALVKRVSLEVVDAAKASAADATDPRRMSALVDAKIMPHVDFARMTAAAVGRAWRQATPEQQERLQDEFKGMLVCTYSGALS